MTATCDTYYDETYYKIEPLEITWFDRLVGRDSIKRQQNEMAKAINYATKKTSEIIAKTDELKNQINYPRKHSIGDSVWVNTGSITDPNYEKRIVVKHSCGQGGWLYQLIKEGSCTVTRHQDHVHKSKPKPKD